MNNVFKKAINASLLLTLFTVLQYVISLVTQALLARNLTDTDFGESVILVMVIMFFITLTSLSSDKYIYVSKKSILSEVVIIESILALFVIVIGVLSLESILDFLNYKNFNEKFIGLLFLCFYMPLIRLRAVHEKNIDFLKARYPYFIGQIIAPILALVSLNYGLGLYSILVWKLSSLIIEVLILNIVFFNLYNKPKFSDFDFKSYFRFSLPLQGAMILVYVYSNIDYAIISQFISPAELGGYWLAFQFTNQLLQGRKIFIAVATPYMNKIQDSRKVMNVTNYGTVLIIGSFSIPLFIFLTHGEWVVTSIFGKEWMKYNPLFVIFSSIILLRSVVTFLEPLCIRYNITSLILKTTMVSTIIVTIAGYYLTIEFGVYGMAFAIFLSVIISNIYSIQYLKGHGIDYPYKLILIVLMILCLNISITYYFSNILFIGSNLYSVSISSIFYILVLSFQFIFYTKITNWKKCL